jgi:hypothetical protein
MAVLVACAARRAHVVPAEVIAQLRSYELDTPPRLLPAVCDGCADAILDRRAQTEEAIAA